MSEDVITIRKATLDDLDAIEAIYELIHDGEEAGETTIGWIRGVYPTRETARAAIEADEMFVEAAGERVVASAKINQSQEDSYAGGDWQHPAAPEEVMVLHTLVVSPAEGGHGYGSNFVEFYEDYARYAGCKYLRMDTNERNNRARAMYAKRGYTEVGIVPTVFNGIPDVMLVLLEKAL